jgi:hypothetical protein
MTRKQDSATRAEWKELMAGQGDLLRPLIQEVIQQVLEAEMDETLSAEKSERTPGRQGYRSGYYGRTLITRVGKLELRVPQDRQGRFRTEVFERYQRSEKALVGALTEMYVQGVSTRKVKAVTEELCGHEFSAATISRLNQNLDGELEQFAERRLEEPYPYLILDARYEKLREAGVIRSQAVMIAIGGGLGRAAECASGGVGQPGIAEQLEGVLPEAEEPRAERGGVGDQRRSRGAAQGDRGSVRRSGLATLLRAFPAERVGLSAAQGR